MVRSLKSWKSLKSLYSLEKEESTAVISWLLRSESVKSVFC